MSEWQPDPLHRHQERLHDGVRWTDQVRDRGVVNRDAAGLETLQPAAPSAPMVPTVAAAPPPRSARSDSPPVFGKIGSSASTAPPPMAPPPMAPPMAPPPMGGPPTEEFLVPVVYATTSAAAAAATVAPPVFGPPPGQSSGLSNLGKNAILTGLLAGAVGGLAGAGIGEVSGLTEFSYDSSRTEVRVQTGLYVAIIGAVLGFVIAAWPHATAKAWPTAVRRGFAGAIMGAIAGFAGGFVAQTLFDSLLSNTDFSESMSSLENKARLYRTLAWALFGAVLGLGLGVRDGIRRGVNGFVGGAIGGAVGGLVFQQLQISMTSDPTVSRFVGLTATGIGIGLGIGIVDRLRREAWISVLTGPLRGREIILFKDVTTVGADSRCDIVLANDPNVQEQHFTFSRTSSDGTSLVVTGPVTVNGALIGGTQVLRTGDEIGVASSTIRFEERPSR